MNLIYKNSGPRLSHIVIAGNTAYVAGQLPEPDCAPDVALQARLVLEKVDKLLAEAGSGRDRIIMASVYLADMDDFATFNDVWDAWVVQGRTPARVCLESRLARPEWKVEVAVIAAV
ncbi:MULTISPECIES: RidA family protein [unclassified Sphingomonas]|uniref:RidA family protein n=1 Tax=unclassified Sphingomonas TaxID=196159 RepID=UPI0006F679B4|nr:MULTISPECIES: RidA family protein [unclassified Sphingomonas]KQX23588.1 hypothetical protein ASD17_03725 [Sphingomonas sp. Root1294]KQY68436.1 hypothetical protein ASD39_06245 [Sphingomonas sp. Root50]KRB91172.1 hypothetical protein ASE22_13050 [Sphingomonas sp. Root720]